MIFQDVCLPVHTSQDLPATSDVPVLAPNGWTLPRWLSQIISSVPSGCPSVVGVELNQMS
ncbi:hypothetical protein SRB17_26470 [Streptomyces sp. RB17]|nr:hypothetical protein [Streptomyces sp. RB17]